MNNNTIQDIPPFLARPAELQTDEAWKKYPHAMDTLGACDALHAEKTYEKYYNSAIDVVAGLNSLFGAYANPVVTTTSHVAAALTWNSLKDEQKMGLPYALREEFANRTSNTQSGYQMKSDIYSSASGYGLDDPAYGAWQSQKVSLFIEKLSKDPVVTAAEKKWNDPSFGILDKLRLADRVHTLHAEAYGFQKADILPYVEKPFKDKASSDEESHQTPLTTNAYYDDSWNAININLYKDKDIQSTIHKDFTSFVGLIAHEGEHTFQSQLSHRFLHVNKIETDLLDTLGAAHSHLELSEEGTKVYHAEMSRRLQEEIPADPGGWNQQLYGDGVLKNHASYMHHNYYEQYMSANQAGFENYLSNPIEQYAHQTDDQVTGYFDSKSDARPNYLENLKSQEQENTAFEGKRLTERQEALAKPQACIL